jgi:hypothetical protein
MQEIKKLMEEARERGEEYKVDKFRRNKEMDEYDLLQWRRSYEEREALLRDICWYLQLLSLIRCNFYHIQCTGSYINT